MPKRLFAIMGGLLISTPILLVDSPYNTNEQEFGFLGVEGGRFVFGQIF
jgi:hypothetical protein